MIFIYNTYCTIYTCIYIISDIMSYIYIYHILYIIYYIYIIQFLLFLVLLVCCLGDHPAQRGLATLPSSPRIHHPDRRLFNGGPEGDALSGWVHRNDHAQYVCIWMRLMQLVCIMYIIYIYIYIIISVCVCVCISVLRCLLVGMT